MKSSKERDSLCGVPALIACGQESNYYPPENYTYLQDRLPQARLSPLPAAAMSPISRTLKNSTENCRPF